MGKPYSENLPARVVVVERPDITLAEIGAVQSVSPRSPDFCII
jgi:hypothetical protein